MCGVGDAAPTCGAAVAVQSESPTTSATACVSFGGGDCVDDGSGGVTLTVLAP